ncbi:CRISPR-associated endonuclease Cas2 [Thiocapsa imhoffii]|uniref:CRISPR-associated endonuclease Cas2 n=1 Tax=Thiocapsa imhoffii TaxID=382777 RepID=UPI001903F63E|nr:CRISPR-associated endonuclease Cas2 [Thiocapsa imhoffii]
MRALPHATCFSRSAFERAMFVFSYDISSPRLARQVRRLLYPLRFDGQLSVHEVILTPPEAGAISRELMEWVDEETDSLVVFRLSRRGDGPVYTLSSARPASLFAHRMSVLPPNLHDGCYILAYDVREVRRLRRLHQMMRRKTVFLQRSLYLFQGLGVELIELLNEVCDLLEQGVDDLRAYALSSPDDLWFLCGAMPPLAEFVK